VKQHTFKRKKRSRYILAVVFVVMVGIVFKTPVFTVTAVKWNLGQVDCVVLSELEGKIELTGKSIFMIDGSDVRSKILDEYPCVKDVNVMVGPGRGVSVDLKEREIRTVVFGQEQDLNAVFNKDEATPSSASANLDWSFPLEDEFFASDDEGVLFEKTARKDVPIILWKNLTAVVGQRVDGEIYKSILLIIDKLGSSALRIKVYDSYLLVITIFKIAFSLDMDISRQLASLQLILQKAKIDGKQIDMIDLRFDKPVVTYKE